MDPLHQVRAVALTDYALVAASVGLKPSRMLNEVGLTAAMLEDGETRLSAVSVAKLLEESATRSGCEDFGIRMAQRRTFESMGEVGPVLKRLRSLREVVAVATKLRSKLNDVFELEIIDEARRSFLRVNVLPQFAGPQATDLVTAMTHVLLRGASSGGWRPKSVHFRHTAPRDSRPFEAFFDSAVRFNTDIGGFQCERDTLDQPFAGDPLVAAVELVSLIEAELSADARMHAETRSELETLLANIRLQIGKIPGCES